MSTVRPLLMLSPEWIEGTMPKPRKRDKAELHPSAKRSGICGVTVETDRFTWICVKSVHAKVYQRRSRRRGQVILDNNPAADNHYFVNKFPYRKVEPE